jgi:hypothetical protein
MTLARSRVSVLTLATLVLAGPTRVGAIEVGSPSAHTDSLRVEAAGPGQFFLGGNQIRGPWILSYATGRLTVNGYGIAAPKKPAEKPVLNPLDQFLTRAGSLADSLNRSGTEPGRATQILYSFCSANSLGVRASTQGNNVILQTPGGGIELHLGFIYHTVLPPSERVSMAQSRANELLRMKAFLEGGGVLFIQDQASQTWIPAPRGGTFMRALVTLRAGQELSAEETHVMTPPMSRRVLHPLELELREPSSKH